MNIFTATKQIMGIVQRQSIIGSIIGYVGVVIGYINVVLLFPRFFSPDEFGLTRVLISAATLLSQLALLGAPQTIIKFFPYFKDGRISSRSFIRFIGTTILFGMVVFSATGWAFKHQIVALYEVHASLFVSYAWLLFPMVIFMTLFEVADAYSKSYFRIVVPVFLRDVFLRILTTLIILLFAFHLIGFSFFINVFVAVYGLCVAAILLYSIRITPQLPPTGAAIIKPSVKKAMWTYGGYSLLSATAVVFISNIDILMLGYILGLKDVAIYSVAFFVATVIQIPHRNISRIMSPILAVAWQHRDIKKIHSLYRQSSITLLIAGVWLFILIWSNIDEIFSLMPKSDIYREGKMVIFFIGISRVLDMAAGINSEILSITRYYIFNLITVLLLIALIVITNYIFIPLYGIEGAAFATLLSVIIYNTIKYWFIFFKIKIQPFSVHTLKVLVVSILLLFAGMYFSIQIHPLASILLKSVVLSVLFFAAIYFSRSSEELNILVKKLVNRWR